jgi:hypothetical protein
MGRLLVPMQRHSIRRKSRPRVQCRRLHPGKQRILTAARPCSNLDREGERGRLAVLSLRWGTALFLVKNGEHCSWQRLGVKVGHALPFWYPPGTGYAAIVTDKISLAF